MTSVECALWKNPSMTDLLTIQDWPGKENISNSLTIEDFYITADDKKDHTESD